MSTVTAYATPAAKAPFTKTTIERRKVGLKDVRIEIKYAGICHSDIHTGRDEWKGLWREIDVSCRSKVAQNQRRGRRLS